MEKMETVQDTGDAQAPQSGEHVAADAGQEEPLVAANTAAAAGDPGGSSSNGPPAEPTLDGLYIEGFEKDLERCLAKTAALRALADVELIEPTRTQKPRHASSKCYYPSPSCPTLGDVDEQECVEDLRSPDDLSALEAQSESTQVDGELVPERSRVFVVPKVTLKRQPIVGLTVQKVDSKRVTVVVDEPVKAPPEDKLSFLELFSFADTMDYFLMFLGSLGACAHGVAVPIFFVFFGRLINAFGFNQHHPHRLAQEVGKVAIHHLHMKPSCRR